MQFPMLLCGQRTCLGPHAALNRVYRVQRAPPKRPGCGITHPRRATHLRAGSGSDMPMRELPDPSTTNINQQQPETAQALSQPPRSSSSVDGGGTLSSVDSDEPPCRPPEPPNFLARLATGLSGLMAMLVGYLVPPALRAAWAVGFGRRLLAVALMGMLGASLALASSARGTASRPREVVYSQFLSLLEASAVRSVRFDDAAGRLLFDLHPGAAESSGGSSSVAAAQTQQQRRQQEQRAVPSRADSIAAAADALSSRARLSRALTAAKACSEAALEAVSLKRSASDAQARVAGEAPRQFYTKRVVGEHCRGCCCGPAQHFCLRTATHHPIASPPLQTTSCCSGSSPVASSLAPPSPRWAARWARWLPPPPRSGSRCCRCTSWHARCWIARRAAGGGERAAAAAWCRLQPLPT